MENDPAPANHAEAIACLMRDVINARPRERAAIFNKLQPAITTFVETTNWTQLPNARRISSADHERFKAQVSVYVRALSTYSIVSDAWRDVFVTFKHMYETHVFGRERNDLLKVQDIDPYKPNPLIGSFPRPQNEGH